MESEILIFQKRMTEILKLTIMKSSVCDKYKDV